MRHNNEYKYQVKLIFKSGTKWLNNKNKNARQQEKLSGLKLFSFDKTGKTNILLN